MIRKFFNVYALYDVRNKMYLEGDRMNLTKDINKAGNFLLFAPVMGLFIKYLDWRFDYDTSFICKKIWMPTVKIDATIYPNVLGRFDNDDKE